MAIQHIPDGSWVSPDGRWLWRGGRWIPTPAAGSTGLFWFTSAPDWGVTLLLMGLIGLIPIVGAMDLYGFAIVTARNLRVGYRVLPPANFTYIGLGAPVVVLSIAWAVIAYCAGLALGLIVGFSTYGQSRSGPWAIAIGLGTGITVWALASIPNLPLLVPALEMSEREGWGIFRIGRLVRHATRHWRSTWFGAGIFLLWSLIYFAMAVLVSFVPLGGIVAAIAGMPVLAAMIAVPIARFQDPPAGFGKGAANALAAAWIALWVLGLGATWGIGIVAASIVSSHPDETACVFESGCSFNGAPEGEVFTRVHIDSADPTLVTVDTTLINRSASQVSIDPADYSARTSTGVDLAPSTDCPAPEAATIAPGARLAQHVCFRLPAAGVGFEVHVPWVGWSFTH